MARVPTLDRRVAPNDVQPQFQDPNAIAGAAGETTARNLSVLAEQQGQAANALGRGGAALSDAATAIASAEQTLNLRADAITRAQAIAEYNAEIQRLTAAAQNEHGFLTEDNVTSYRQAIGQARDQIIGKYEGQLKAQQSPFTLRAQFAEATSAAEQGAVTAGIASQKALIDRDYGNYLGNLTNVVSGNPSAVFDAIDDITKKVARDVDPAFDPTETVARHQQGVEQVVTAAVDKLLANLDVEGAKLVLADPRVQEALGQKEGAAKARELQKKMAELEGAAEMDELKKRKLRLEIEKAQQDILGVIPGDAGRKARLDIAAAEAALEDRRAKARTATNVVRSVLPDFQADAENLAVLARAAETMPLSPTAEDVENLVTQVTGTLDPQVQSRIRERYARPLTAAGISDPKLQTQFLGDQLALRVKSGAASRAEFVHFIGLATFLSQPEGIHGTRGVLSPLIRDALQNNPYFNINPDKLGQDISGIASSVLTGTARDVTRAATSSEASRDDLAAVDTAKAEVETALQPFVPQAGVAEPPAGEDPEAAPSAVFARQSAAGIRYFDAVTAITGPVSRIQSILGRLPYIADEVPGGRNARYLQQEYEIFKTAAVAALRRTARFADAERQQLQQQTLAQLQGASFFQDPGDLAIALASLDHWVKNEIAFIDESLDNPTALSEEGKKERTDVRNQLLQVSQLIGAPPLVSTKQQLFDAVTAGFIKPDGAYVAFDRGEYTLLYFDKKQQDALGAGDGAEPKKEGE